MNDDRHCLCAGDHGGLCLLCGFSWRVVQDFIYDITTGDYRIEDTFSDIVPLCLSLGLLYRNCPKYSSNVAIASSDVRASAGSRLIVLG